MTGVVEVWGNEIFASPFCLSGTLRAFFLFLSAVHSPLHPSVFYPPLPYLPCAQKAALS